jgi:hypothetical protein
MIRTRRRFKQTVSFDDRLRAFIQEILQEAEAVPPGAERSEILKKANQAEAAREIDAWANSPVPRPRSARDNRD